MQVLTVNIHKGYDVFNTRSVLHGLREAVRAMGSDVVFLQEVKGGNGVSDAQYEFLADEIWPQHAYGRNAVYDEGHHGNAILSKFPITRWDNEDVSQSRFESRGLLHCEIEVPGWPQPLHCINVHLALFAMWRRRQIERLKARIDRLVPPDAPLIIAGDFNDWTRRTGRGLRLPLGLTEVFEHTAGRPARSFPALMPVLNLDRIYTRGFRVKLAHAHHGRHSARLSDHVALSALLVRG